MKYIHIIEKFSLEGGGVKSVVADVSQQMALNGHDVYVLAMSIPDGYDKKTIDEWGHHFGVKTYVINDKLSWKGSFKFVRKKVKELATVDNCCLYMHLKRGVLCGILSTLFLKSIKRVEVYHSGYKNYRVQAFLCKLFIDHYLAVSKESKDQLVNQFHIPSKKITVAYNGVDVNAIRQAVARDNSKKEGGVSFLTVGRLAFQKNIFLSVKAFVNLRNKGKLEDAKYLIAGDGPDREKLVELAEEKVTFLGLIDRDSVYSNIATADVVLFPSRWEGNSIALLETLAIGCALVVTDIPSFREVLGNQPLRETELFRPEPFGAVFNKDSVESCMAAMDYVYKHSGDISKMKSFVYGLADNYTVEKQTDIYVKTANL